MQPPRSSLASLSYGLLYPWIRRDASLLRNASNSFIVCGWPLPGASGGLLYTTGVVLGLPAFFRSMGAETDRPQSLWLLYGVDLG